jgi:mersacidin/lichenicidin family type 2 lantibiotic
MSQVDIIRAWKDEEYFHGLSESERWAIPRNPAGIVELTDEDLGFAQGGTTTFFTLTITLTVTVTVTVTHNADEAELQG